MVSCVQVRGGAVAHGGTASGHFDRVYPGVPSHAIGYNGGHGKGIAPWGTRRLVVKPTHRIGHSFGEWVQFKPAQRAQRDQQLEYGNRVGHLAGAVDY
eukprot:6046111-Pyramimonas_sp.AAC.1